VRILKNRETIRFGATHFGLALDTGGEVGAKDLTAGARQPWDRMCALCSPADYTAADQ
jgi:hypothetical protein